MSGPDHWACRTGIISMQAGQLGSNPVLRFGDSISEEMATPPFSGTGHNNNCLNAGFMGLGIADAPHYLSTSIGVSNPWAILLQLGSNDAAVVLGNNNPTYIANWLSSFGSMIGTALSTGAKTVVKTIPPTLLGNTVFDQNQIDQMNVGIRTLCHSYYPTSILVDLDIYLRCASTGYARPGILADGVHLGPWAAFTVYYLEQVALTTQAWPAPLPPC